MLIQVSQEDIDEARKTWESPDFLRCQTCPVARAIERTTGRAVYVVPDTFTFVGGKGFGEKHVHQFPLKVMQFICRFDAGKLVEPFQFEIDPISQHV